MFGRIVTAKSEERQLGFCLLSLAATAAAQDHCSLVVKVVDRQGTLLSTPVRVEEQNGRRHDGERTRNGVSFCALGLYPVTVTVGRNGCPQTIDVRDVELSWGVTKELYVLYEESCHPATLFVSHGGPPCDFLFRFMDHDNKPVRDVSLKTVDSEPVPADQYGRVLLPLAFEERWVGTATAHGYEPVALNLRCTRERQLSDQTLKLEPVRADNNNKLKSH
jgi:hypothetical protein